MLKGSCNKFSGRFYCYFVAGSVRDIKTSDSNVKMRGCVLLDNGSHRA